MNISPPPKIVVASDERLDQLKSMLRRLNKPKDLLGPSSPWRKGQRVDDVIADLPEASESYAYPDHYLVFATTHLREAGILDEDELTDDLSRQRRHLTTVLSRDMVDTERLAGERLDIDEIRRDFHGGGELDDPLAKEALAEAIRVIKANLLEIKADDALIIVTY